eukprot:3676662-Lingulodinium_polyedra.AAC.1
MAQVFYRIIQRAKVASPWGVATGGCRRIQDLGQGLAYAGGSRTGPRWGRASGVFTRFFGPF